MISYSSGAGSALDGIPDNITQVFGLVLNPMRGRAEEQRLIAVSDSRENLVQILRAEKTEPYSDDRWQKTYKSGGALEWFNPPSCDDGAVDNWGNGIIELKRDAWRRVA